MNIGDRVLTLKTAGGKNVSIPLASPSVGDKVALIQTGSGKPVAVKLSELSVGDKVVLVPTTSGKPVAIPLVSGSECGDGSFILRDTIDGAGVTAVAYLGGGVAVAAATYGSWGTSGYVLRSTNYGRTWTVISSSISLRCFCDLGSRVVLGGGIGGIYKSTNSGKTWTFKQAPTPSTGGMNEVEAICDLGSNICIAGTRNFNGSPFVGGEWWRSTDAGENWTLVKQVSYLSGVIAVTSLINLGSGVCLSGTWNGSGLAPRVYKSTDSGANWSAIYLAGGTTAPIISSFAKLDDGTVFLALGGTASSDSQIQASGDSGDSWSLIYNPSEYYFYSIVNLGGGVMFAGSHTGTIHVSSDSGANWAVFQSGLDGLVRALARVSGTAVLAGVGGTGYGADTGYIYKACSPDE